MRHPFIVAAAAAFGLGLGLATTPLHAASSTSSAVSDSVGVSSNSLSKSSDKSSDSSTAKKVAQGDYEVTEVAVLEPAALGAPAQVRVRLQAVADAGPDGLWFLTLPQAVWQGAALDAGQRVAATPRPYGVEFARADTRRAFFLVLADDWQRELDPRPVVL